MTALQAKLYKHNRVIKSQLKDSIVDHFKRMSPEDRYTRFFSSLNDNAIEKYVDKMMKDSNESESSDQIFLTAKSFCFDIQITGLLHVASLGDDSYEIGISVDKDARREGIAKSLFDRAFIFLNSNGCKKIYINCLSTNVAMQKIVSKYKFSPENDPSDPYTKTAVLEMDAKPDFYAWLKGIRQDQIALFDLAISGIKQ